MSFLILLLKPHPGSSPTWPVLPTPGPPAGRTLPDFYHQNMVAACLKMFTTATTRTRNASLLSVQVPEVRRLKAVRNLNIIGRVFCYDLFEEKYKISYFIRIFNHLKDHHVWKNAKQIFAGKKKCVYSKSEIFLCLGCWLCNLTITCLEICSVGQVFRTVNHFNEGLTVHSRVERQTWEEKCRGSFVNGILWRQPSVTLYHWNQNFSIRALKNIWVQKFQISISKIFDHWKIF